MTSSERNPYRNLEYWQALGRFIESFAGAERMLYNYVVRIAEMPPKVAHVVCESWKTSALLTFVDRLHKLTPPPSHSPDIPKALTQFTLLNNLRNVVAHRPSYIDVDGLRKAARPGGALPDKPPRIYDLSPELLQEMASEASRISMHLITVMLHPGESLEDRSKSIPALQQAWREIPTPNQPTPRGKRSR
jgi:hypothetical protein